MSIPMAMAGAAGLAYLNGKTGWWHDKLQITGILKAAVQMKYRSWKDQFNLFYRLEYRALDKSSANRTFLVFEGRTWTYAQVYEMALKYGQWFQKNYNVKAKDVVAIDLMNSDYFGIIVFGLWSIGARPAFINYNLTGDALAHCVSLAESAIMIVDPDVAHNVDETVRSKLPNLSIVELTPAVIAEVAALEPVRAADPVRTVSDPREMAALIYTSGTTGLPKAAVISWTKANGSTCFIGNWLQMTPEDIFYTSMPLYHSSASIFGMINCLEVGCTFAIGRKFSTKVFWKDVREVNATMIQYVGETCRYLTLAPPQIDPTTGENLDQKHRVRVAFGNGLRPDVWDKFKDRFGIETIAEFYAATEAPMGVFNISRNDFTRGAIGRHGWLQGLMFKAKLALVEIDPDTDLPARDPKTGLCIQAKSGEPGELMAKLPDDSEQDFQGYYKNSKATSGKIFRDVKVKGDIYFRSGDLITWDSEGRFYFQDRIGDTFRWKSENVATTEVSQAMGLHPQVQEANVYGVQLPNHDGRAGCVSIVLHQAPDAALLKSLASHAREKLPKYAVPIFLRVAALGSMQSTGTNKQQKHGLRAEGVDPSKVRGEELFWLQGDSYVKFAQPEWDGLEAGRVKL